MWKNGSETRGIIVGVAFSVLFHFALAALLFGAANARSEGSGAAAGEENAHPRRRGGYAEQAMRDRRQIEGPYPRLRRFGEGRMDRREALYVRGRRSPFDESGRPYRFLELPSGRRDLAGAQRAKVRSIDFGPADEQILMAMVIPKLGRKKAVKGELPKLTKYEQPERVEDGINVSRDNPDGSPMRFKEFKRKKSQYDRRRKKAPTLDDLIDAPDDDDPRARATALDDIVGLESGSVHGTGSEESPGNVYLGRVQNAIQEAFNVPVFLTRDELKKLVVDIEIRQMDGKGYILAYTLRRNSKSSAFDSAALEAIRRFVPSEGGTRKLPEPDAEMLNLINRRGVLVRLEGRKLR